MEKGKIERMKYRCECENGDIESKMSGGDGRKCNYVEELILFENRNEIREISIEKKYKSLNLKKVGNMKNVVGVEFEYEENKMMLKKIRKWDRIDWV
jgi:hypothetical protein